MSTEVKKRGMAALTPERRREISRMGGLASSAKGVSHRWDTSSARRAGQKGGSRISQDRDHMAEIGRQGAASRRAKMLPNAITIDMVDEMKLEDVPSL